MAGKYVRTGEQTDPTEMEQEAQSEGMNPERDDDVTTDTNTECDSNSSDSDGNESDSEKSGSDEVDSIGSGNEADATGNGPIHPTCPEQSLIRPTEAKANSENGQADMHQTSVAKNPSGEITNERMDRIEKVLECMASAIQSLQKHDRTAPSSSHRETEPNWSEPVDATTTAEKNPSAIRWDNIQPFPSGVPANKMWEEWNRYIENFEIASSLSNVNDPVKRTQLLFLSMGPELQEIVRAAKLRPSLTDVNCYKTFVASIHAYFRAMTDTAAEHEAFSSMRQERSESAVAFHARLMCKVRLCGYSDDDQDRFVRAQLLKGLRNKELVKASRTYGYTTNFIVQAATRDEAYEAEISEPTTDHVFQMRRQNTTKSINHKRRSPDNPTRDPPGKRRQIDPAQGRRSRCSHCNLSFHRNGRCPALDKNCLNCGKVGHFAAACRSKRVNEVRFKQEDTIADQKGKREDDKQVRET